MRARKNGYSGRPVGLRDQLLPEEEDEDEEKEDRASRSLIICCRVTRIATTACSCSGW